MQLSMVLRVQTNQVTERVVGWVFIVVMNLPTVWYNVIDALHPD